MKKTNPTREEDRFKHALARPVRHLPFEMIELMRADLFQYLDILSSEEYDGDNRDILANRNGQIQRVAARLKELTPLRAKALRAAIKAGRVEMSCEPGSPPIAEKTQKYWQRACR